MTVRPDLASSLAERFGFDLVETEGVDEAYVAETHVHNDYLSGGLALARATGAQYLVPEGAEVAFAGTPVREGTTLTAGFAKVRVLSTPGHTPHHVTYLVGTGDATAAAFTGDSLLYGSVGPIVVDDDFERAADMGLPVSESPGA